MSDPLSTETQHNPAPATSQKTQKSKSLSWTVINFWLDFAMAAVFLFLLWVVAIVRFVFPAGASERTLWGVDKTGWEDLQFLTICVFAAAVLVHVMLHWSWICGVINKQIFKRTIIKTDGTDTLIGVILIVAFLHVLGISVLFAWYSLK
ncbi:MAG: DUF4405 domain-containing protein [Planctomycetaceae bacterium]|nr:DUF4405 domain-containing protein [Planctomycetaceae bacterium]